MLKEKALQVLDELANNVIKNIGPTKLVVGLSGGADSTLVLLIAKRITELNGEFSALAVHCIHGLDADDPIWFNHCTSLCKRVGVPLVTPKLNIIYGDGKSPEDVSRQERYRALLENTRDGALMLGHHADDQVESFLLALKRGSGPYGLSGMRFILNDERGTIIRPLLTLHKREIIEIIEALGYDYVFDISNTYLKFERNFMRLKVLPLLKERFSGIEKSILRSSLLCSYEHDLASRYAKEYFDLAYDRDNDCLCIDKLDLKDEPLVTSIMRLFICTKVVMPPEFNTVLLAVKLCSIGPDQNMSVSLNEGCALRRYKDRLYIVKNAKTPEKGQYTLEYGKVLVLGDYEYRLVEDCSSKESFANGRVVLDFDYKGSQCLKPLKRIHSREIKKLFGEYNIPTWKRPSQCLVKDEAGHILAFGSLFVTAENSIEKGYKLQITCLK